MKYYAYARVKFPVTDTHVYISPVMLLFLRETGIHHLWLSNLTAGTTVLLNGDIFSSTTISVEIAHLRTAFLKNRKLTSTKVCYKVSLYEKLGKTLRGKVRNSFVYISAKILTFRSL